MRTGSVSGPAGIVGKPATSGTGMVTASTAFGGAIFGASLGGGLGTILGGILGAATPIVIRLLGERRI